MEGSTAYPRPQLQRADWTSLNGPWRFAFDADRRYSHPSQITHWPLTINVPFPPESRASGIGDSAYHPACWYERSFDVPAGDRRVILHFGAVDYRAKVWVNGHYVTGHEGGHTPFSADITSALDPSGHQTVALFVEDDPHDLAKPRGKQDWQLEPHSIWYPRTTGIWQTVWLERVAPTFIEKIRWTPHVEGFALTFEARIGGAPAVDLALRLRLAHGDRVLADDVYRFSGDEVNRRIILADPGIDDYRNELLWSPERPTLLEAQITLTCGEDVLDEVQSYTALRALTISRDRIALNGRPYTLRLVLDQGYWPESLLAAPSDGALRRDVELAKAMGFNGVRKHQKVEDPRYLYWADRLGLLVWEEMPSAYRFTWRSVERLTREWAQVIERDVSHPCIVAWVPFNESWGAPNLPDNPAERHYIRSVYHLTKTLDPTRPVIGNDGWESVATDIIGIHDYDPDPARIGRRYHADEVRPRLFRRERPGGRLLVLEGQPHTDHPIVLSEFGGIAYTTERGCWGYSRCSTADEFAERFTTLLQTVRSLDLLAGYCYTQFADTYQEANGLLFADRRPKFALARIAEATSGAVAPEPARSDDAEAASDAR